MDKKRIIVALDFDSEQKALALVRQLDANQCRLKVGKELFTRTGPAFMEKVQGMGFEVFLDLKFHDIPNTVARACQAAADLGVWMVNIHALGGRKMMAAAREAITQKGASTKLIAVTILTSMGEQDLAEIGLKGTPAEHVAALAELARDTGLDGVVCSPLEVQSLRTACGPEFLLVTPGVRPAGAAQDDQKRIMTPAQALQAGSSYLVIGRPITQAQDPQAALGEIFTEIQ
jgi:orotidine-5'-phosphate decarboxylase